jgi:hypothetical protein
VLAEVRGRLLGVPGEAQSHAANLA